MIVFWWMYSKSVKCVNLVLDVKTGGMVVSGLFPFFVA